MPSLNRTERAKRARKLRVLMQRRAAITNMSMRTSRRKTLGCAICGVVECVDEKHKDGL